MTIYLRPALPGDEEFLYSVYASTRTEELTPVGWDAAQQEAFLRMQFQAQSRYYIEHYSGAEFYVILTDDQPSGRLYVHRRDDEIRIMDIALLPAFRNQGIGSELLAQILQEGEEKQLPVTIHVERFNPALRLYERLGFCLSEDKGVYFFLKRLPTRKEQYDSVGSIAAE
jgi:ribosomal protein S18 acetylase RimI-like enzyme